MKKRTKKSSRPKSSTTHAAPATHYMATGQASFM